MKVQDIMTRDVQCCGPGTNLAAAAKMMWDSDCGALPVLNVEGKVIGVITDRDVCMATATKKGRFWSSTRTRSSASSTTRRQGRRASTPWRASWASSSTVMRWSFPPPTRTCPDESVKRSTMRIMVS